MGLFKNYFLRVFLTLLLGVSLGAAYGQGKEPLFEFGEVVSLENTLGLSTSGQPRKLRWFDVNTSPDTWEVRDSILVCKGLPIGVARSEFPYENYVLHVEWRHMEAGGNSGMFMWSSAEPGSNRLPDGVEVQMLELEWVKINAKDGVDQPIAYVHGELFGTGGVETVPENPRGKRSKSIENRCKGKGEWNTYDVICVDGTVKLSVNGKFVNGIYGSTQRKGYMCLESEGAEIHFKNLKVVELPAGFGKFEPK